MALKSKRKRNIRSVSAVCALLILLPCLLFFASSGAAAGAEEEAVLTDGVYRIRNFSTGMYLGAYKLTAKSAGKAYLSASAAGDSAQCVRLESAGQDTYRLYPQNENGSYCFSWNNGTEPGALLSKTQNSGDGSTLFDVIRLPGGTFTVAPSAGDNPDAVLDVTGNTTEFGHFYAGIGNYVSGKESQMWVFEPVRTEAITLAFAHTRLKLYSAGAFCARKYPYNVSEEDVEWTSSDDSVLMVGNGGKYSALSTGTVTVTASCGGLSASMTVEVVDSPCFTWYSQNNIYTSDWDASILKNVFFASGAYKMRFAADTFDEPHYASWIDTGCALCSVAAVLHNMDARMTSGYDLRSGQNGNLPVDPYIVGLANSGNIGVESADQVMYGNPVYMNWDYLARRFNVDGEQVVVKKIFNPSRKIIKEMIDTHPQGVVILLCTPSRSHYVVFSECLNPEETNTSKYEFRVYDPAAYYAPQGDGVPFQETTSYVYSGYRYSSISTMIIYDVESNINN